MLSILGEWLNLSCGAFLGSSDLIVGTLDYNYLNLCNVIPSSFLFSFLPLASGNLVVQPLVGGHITSLGNPPRRM